MKASCEWEINQISLALDKMDDTNHVCLLEHPTMLKKFTHGIVQDAQIVMSLKKAIELRDNLDIAITQYLNLENY